MKGDIVRRKRKLVGKEKEYLYVSTDEGQLSWVKGALIIRGGKGH